MKCFFLIIVLFCSSYSFPQIHGGKKYVFLDSNQLVTKFNYPCEEHLVRTDDGFILKLFRIPSEGPPVLLVHGIGDSSDSWLVQGPKRSLGFLLSDLGLDIWIYNARGNKYSKNHTRRISNKEYWNFSFDKMGTNDLPSTIDYILNVKQEKTLTYVGFSQGTTIFLIMCSTRPEYNDRIKHAVLLAPVAWIHNTRYPFMPILAQNYPTLTYLRDHLGLYEIFTPNQLQNIYHAEVCKHNSAYKQLCALEYYFSYGLNNVSHISPEAFPIIASHIPAGVSSFTAFHYIQNYITKRFQKFDYESAVPLSSNGQYVRKLPEYNLTQVTVPITMIASATDWLSDEEDVNRLRRSLRTVANHIIISEEADFSHIEFVYGSRVNALVNKPLIKIMQNLLNIHR